MSIDSINSATTATDKGTKIVKSTGDMDKDAFLKILTAELSNQDPDNAKDSTQYISQMAQFSSLEQMSNMNSNMQFSGASALIGKNITLNSFDSMGNQYYGTVKGTVKDGSSISLDVEVTEDGKSVVKEFPYEQVLQVYAPSDTQTSTANTTNNTTTTSSSSSTSTSGS